MKAFKRFALASIAVLAGVCCANFPAVAQKTLRVVMHSDVKVIDPIWTTAYITRDYGYMIYDTLFSLDENGEIRPQMVDSWTLSEDKLNYLFKLRDGLEWHDGKPVTADDCVASIKRWAAKDGVGQKLTSFVASIEVVSESSFSIKLKEPTGLVLIGLSKPSSNVPFMMPKRVADTNPNEQISDTTGSGPFVLKRDEWRPGDKVVFVKNQKYRPRAEPASGLAGGKIAKLDRVEWRVISDMQTALSALQSGEIDYVQTPKHDLLPLLKQDAGIKLWNSNPLGNQYLFRPNWTAKPFDDPRIRKALWYAFNQKDFLDAAIGDPAYYKLCKAMFGCGAPLGSDTGMETLLNGDMAKAQALLKEANYDGTPIIVLHATDLDVITNLAPVARWLMEKAGFKVDMQSMDWQTLVARRAKRDPPGAGGWHAFLTSIVTADVTNPIMAFYFNSACKKAPFGWP